MLRMSTKHSMCLKHKHIKHKECRYKWMCLKHKYVVFKAQIH
jgi:hypothetical protein